MNIEALVKLKEVLLEDSANKPTFDMSHWFIGESLSCGTSACAAGTAALHPWFKERGLQLLLNGTLLDCPGLFKWTVVYRNSDKEIYGYKALALFFDISDYETYQVFDPGMYKKTPSVENVVRRIDELLLSKG